MVSDVRQTEIHTTEPLVPEPSAFEVEIAIEKLKRHKSPGTDQNAAEIINAGGRTIHSEIHKVLQNSDLMSLLHTSVFCALGY
jgi:hypothetical protein